MIQPILPQGAPSPRGPYSPAVRAGDFIFVSGQGPVDAQTDQLSPGDIRHETRLTLANIRRILESGGASIQDVVKVCVYLVNAAEFAAMNEVYAEVFGEHRPARTTVQAGMVAPMRIEIDCIAYKPVAGTP
ncbi:MAG: RidA family protein [Bryobacteraceae bacterium]|jgi:2-iminobutanoate/2-iminopropanoate deaminase